MDTNGHEQGKRIAEDADLADERRDDEKTA
jgi:hypothetical protein